MKKILTLLLLTASLGASSQSLYDRNPQIMDSINQRMRYADSVNLSNRINSLVTAMLNYVKTSDTSNMLNPYLRKFDTTAMLLPYLRAMLGMRYSDTAAMLTPYIRSLLAMKYTDTASMLQPYVKAKLYIPGYNPAKPIIIADTVVTPTTGNGYSVDISRFGFTNTASMNVQIQVFNNTNTVTSMPIVSGKTFTSTSVTFNTVFSNSQTISILGLLVVGLQLPSSLSNVTAHIHLVGQ